ncbi:MAG: hypothetical protein WCB68_21225 [Pyrinomonadaceae bacterium]
MYRTITSVVKTLSPILVFSLVFVSVLGAKAWSKITPLKQEAAAQDKVVEIDNFPNSPVEIVDLHVKDMNVKLGEKFKLDNDWLRTIRFKLKNISDKPITHISLNLDFPETTSADPRMAYSLEFGQRPGARQNKSGPIFLIKGDMASVALSEAQYADLKRFVETKRPLTTINRVLLSIPLVFFADGTVWSGGTLYRPDPTAPNKMRAVDAQ